MSKQGMKVLQQTSLLDGDNGAYLESLYESWLQDSDSVPENWREYFTGLPQVNGQTRGDILCTRNCARSFHGSPVVCADTALRV